MVQTHMVARSLIENRIQVLTRQKTDNEERVAVCKAEAERLTNQAQENDLEIRILTSTLGDMESLV